MEERGEGREHSPSVRWFSPHAGALGVGAVLQPSHLYHHPESSNKKIRWTSAFGEPGIRVICEIFRMSCKRFVHWTKIPDDSWY